MTRLSVGVACLLLACSGAYGVEGTACPEFCQRALKICKGHDAPFDSMDECLQRCPTFPTQQSTPYADILGDNSLPCRQFWLRRVEMVLAETGSIPPGLCDYMAEGGGMCDASVPHSCDGYCGQMVGDEGDCGEGPWSYRDEKSCIKACKSFPRGQPDSMRGNSLECRLLYINIGEQSAYPKAKPEFCPFAGKDSAMCSDGAEVEECADYCEWNAKFCRSDESTEGCLAYCKKLPAEQRACHLKYVAAAARCTSPDVPCFHRQVCTAPPGKPLGFEGAPIWPTATAPSEPADDDADASDDYDGKDEM